MKGGQMSIFYTLYSNTPLSIASVEQVIGKAAISQDTLDIDFIYPTFPRVNFIERDFHFNPTISISYSIDRKNYVESIRAMITTVVKLLTADAGDLVLLYQVDSTILQRLQSSLILNDTDFWRPEYRALLPLPYTVEKLPDL
jgi:hypothetical protein